MLFKPKWSKAKKQLMSFVCEPLRTRVDFQIINYRKAHDQLGRAVITAIEEYVNLPIDESLKSSDILIKILCLLDRRVGKRTLRNMRTSINEEPNLVKYFYELRCEVEHIRLA